MTVWVGLKAATFKGTVQQDGRLVKTYTHTYLYRTDAATRPTFADIAADLGVAPGSPYADDANATAGEASIEHLPTRPTHCAAEITVTWATNNPVPNADDTDPSTVRVLWDLQTVLRQEYITHDKDDDIILNSAGQPFDGGIPVDRRLGQAIAKLKVLEADFDKSVVMKHSGKINSATFLGATAGKLQVDVSASEEVSGAFHFWNIQYTFTYFPDGVQPRVQDCGFYQLATVGAITVPIPITMGDLTTPPTGDTTRVPEPEPLDGSGHVVPYDDRPASCAKVTIQAFDSLDFSTLPGM